MSDPLRIAFVAVNPAGSRTGNEVTLQRLARLLSERGVTIEIVRPDEPTFLASARLAVRSPPALVHGFHARRTGPRAQQIARNLGVPLVVSVTGTDIGRDATDPSRAPTVRAVLRSASAVLCGHSDEVAKVRAIAGDTTLVEVTPKSVAIPERLPEPALSTEPGECLVVQVAHLRPVKNALFAIQVINQLRAQGVPLRLLLLGDVLDERYTQKLREAAGTTDDWDRMWRPTVPHDEVGGYYAAADVVLNTSDVEGGSNAILEAMAHRRAVVASAVPGNVAFVGSDGTRGLLYDVHALHSGELEHDPTSLAKILRRLAIDAGVRKRLGDAAHAWVTEHRSPEAEASAVLSLYRRTLAQS